MAITDGNSNELVMPVQPLGYGGGSGNYGSMLGGDSWLGILLLIAVLNGGWGGFGGFGGFGGGYGAMMGMGMMDGFGLYPWLNNSQNINDGFRTQALGTQVGGIQNSITAGFGDVQTALCGGFAGVNQNISNGTATIQNSLCNGFNGVNQSINGAQNALAQQLYTNQISDLERSFAAQTANAQGFNNVQSQLVQNGYNQAAGTADLKYTITTEACADRATSTQNTQSILSLVNSGIQSIKDQLCQDKIDAKNDEIAQLRQEILYTRGQAAAESIYQRGQNSQDVQTAQILAGQAAIPGQVYTRLNECPVSTVPVYGRQPIFTCPTNQCNSCGCGCGSNF